jgi:TonB family protein
MRSILVASLLSSLALTAAAATGKPVNDASSSSSNTTGTRPVSTGVTKPQLVYSTKIEIPEEMLVNAFSNPARVVLKVNLDATGSPTHVEVVEPFTQEVDALVLDAVRQFRWRPAVLDNQTIPIEMNLAVEVQH